MDINRLTEKAQEALRAAQSEATRQGGVRVNRDGKSQGKVGKPCIVQTWTATVST